jgi:hypothetical protein
MRLDYFFDEMWRIDFIRSGNWLARARLQNAFVPPGWIIVLRPFRPIFDSPFGWRFVGIGCLALFLGFLVSAFGAVDGPTRSTRKRRVAFFTAAGAMAVLPLLPAFSDLTSYFNDYFFQAAYMAFLVFLCIHLDDHRWCFPTTCVALALAPAFVIGGLFALPAIVAWLVLWAWRQDERQLLRHTILALGSVAAMALVGGTVYLTLYRPTLSADIKDFWKADRLDGAGGFLPLMTRTFDLFVDGVLRLAFPSLQNSGRLVAGVALLIALGIGTWLVARRFPWLAALPYVGWLGVFTASIVQGWPATPVRVNLPFVAFAYAFAAYGLFHVVAQLTKRSAPVVLLAVVALVAFWVPRTDADPNLVFARGLRDDLQVIRQDPSNDDLVLAYHFMSHWYVHDALVNDGRPGQHVTIVRDIINDPTLTANAASIAQPTFDGGGTVWCVLPYVLGPQGSDEACHLDGPGIVRVADYHGIQARIIGFRKSR